MSHPKIRHPQQFSIVIFSASLEHKKIWENFSMYSNCVYVVNIKQAKRKRLSYNISFFQLVLAFFRFVDNISPSETKQNDVIIIT